MARAFVFFGAVNAFLAVALGAFGAHGLRDRLAADMLEVYKTGAQYHLIHALGLILIGALAERRRAADRLVGGAGWLLLAGIVLFSGSLYALAVTGVRALGAITPFGGVCFLTGWALLAVAALRQGPAEEPQGQDRKLR